MFERIRTIRGALAEGRDEEDGFTLIELLIVIVVLGILAAVTVFGLSGTASQSAVSACKADARTVEVAVDAYHANDLQGNWPADFPALTDPTNPSSLNTVNSNTQPTTAQPYLRGKPVSTHYTITLGANGAVMVTTPPATGTPTNFDTSSPNICESVK
jgi:prepilin-type N-terminal cleavage/methylation domain-containing protein